MPQEKKKRGRREEKTSKKRKVNDQAEKPSKRFKPEDHHPEDFGNEFLVSGEAGDDFISFEIPPPDGVQAPVTEGEFHGLLDPEEQEYYSNVNAKIVSNDFESEDDRTIFIEAVHRETEGKELKVASSQSCSRYLEKIILLSTPLQLRGLFSKFLGNLTSLVQHRFGSHCCETLFLQAAKFIGQEKRSSKEESEDTPASLEELFLRASGELKPNMGFLLTERFASHTVRVLFLVLSGLPLDDSSVKSMLASKKKEKIDTPEKINPEMPKTKRVVPKSFHQALSELIQSAISSLDTTYLRALATHPLGNPVLQLLLQLELSSSNKNKSTEDTSLFSKLFPEANLEHHSDSAKFLSGLIYDPAGSHLVELLVQRLPGKQYKTIYKAVLKPKLDSMAKNDAASYVAVRILERLGKDDLIEAKRLILPVIPTLISRQRTGLIKVLIERSAVRGADLQDLADVIKAEYGNGESSFISNVLNAKLEEENQEKSSADTTNADSKASRHKTDVHGSLLAQAMLQAKPTANVVHESLLSLSTDEILALCRDPPASRLVQASLSPSHTNIAFRRQFIPNFSGHMVPLSLELTSSYVADALYAATDGLHFMKEKLAGELAGSETQLRESPFGRNVWKNWAMDLFRRRQAEWRALAKGQTAQDQAQGIGGSDRTGAGKSETKKTAIQLARERHAHRKPHGSGSKPSKLATGSNAIVSTNA
ncbi:uncharacterized protein A1O9_00787 [Exophiala aquamarina CBS 119918]|uniref:Nucleolar protein 9 n=1 Tax=Exophiala aquamarina CBS 119918 TaxID=1182545 RepID=A0A072PRX0_9EURO|nr:uncharacterized protein A1O9_00787 [Exophiala aquamarina CBS 119918]KEF62814.1 hypothetical protein A1O9_00787 [Exophiala aquamarina CBS 119918]